MTKETFTSTYFIPEPNRPTEMPFDDIHFRIEEAIEKLKVARVRHACRNAFNHLRKAWTLHPIDAEMSAFRAITAEEEASTAVIRALNHRKYRNANRLNERNHVHKSAIWPFITAVSDKLAEKNIPLPTISLRVEGEPRVELSLDIASLADLGRPLWGTLNEPFNFTMLSDRTGPLKLHDFSEDLRKLAMGKGAQDIESYVKNMANTRNQLLYASESGIPSVNFEDNYLLSQRRRVTVLLIITIAIMQTDLQQLFFVQCIDALLRAIQRFDGEPLKLPGIDPRVERLELTEQTDGNMKLKLIQPTTVSFRFMILPPTPES